MKNNYPDWIDEYTKAFYQGFKNMVPISWGPIDGMALIAHLNGAFLEKIYKAIENIRIKNYSFSEIAKNFSCPSELRVALYYLIFEYQYSEPKDKKRFREIMEFFLGVLSAMMKEDMFACQKNIAHSKTEIKEILNAIEWRQANPQKAREIGKLYNSLSALVFALYRDFFPQVSHEIYGPYDAADKFGKGLLLLIKHFPDIKPVEIWREADSFEYSDVKIYQIFKNVKFKCETVGMHSIYEGDLINNLIYYAVTVDGKIMNDEREIKSLSDYFANLATEKSSVCDSLSKEQLVKKFLEWECYQFFYFFKLAGINWRPTQRMSDMAVDKNIPARFEVNTFPSLKEYVRSPEFEIYWLKDLYN